MTITNKILPTIALGLASMLSVCNAGEATWDNTFNRIVFDNTNYLTPMNYGRSFSKGEIVSIGVKVDQSLKTFAEYRGKLAFSNGAKLDISYYRNGAQFKLNGGLEVGSGSKAEVYLGLDNIFSASSSNSLEPYGVVLNGGDLNVEVYSLSDNNDIVTKSDFQSSVYFKGSGNALFDFAYTNINAFGVSPKNMLIFDTTNHNGSAIFRFTSFNNISFRFGEQSSAVSTKDQEDVLLKFDGYNNNISFYSNFTNMKITFGDSSVPATLDASNNTYIRTYGKTDSIKPIRWIVNNASSGANNSIVSFSHEDNIGYNLEIGEKGNSNTGVSGAPVNFIVGVNTAPKYSNTIKKDILIIHAGSGTHNLGVRVFGSDDFNPTQPLLIASIANDSNVILKPIDGYVSGFVLSKVEYDTPQLTDANGGSTNKEYTSFYIKSAKNVGVAPVNQSITSSALALNYDLFIGNFNSLNKRMGELRDDPYSQGAWARVFNGQISNDFSGSKNNYTTIQMGYDHKLGEFENASNYLGASVSYLLGLSDQHSIDSSSAYLSRSIKDVISNGVEIALYNSYVQDEGWFSDSIAKFSYLASDFNILDNTNNTSEKQSTSNIAFTLSEEFGYRFKLGESKAWYLDPQVEMALGYFSGTDLKQVAGNDYLDAKSDSMLMFRARVGTAVGYDFKDFTADKDFNAKLYVGLSYEADFVSGGDVTLTPNNGNAMSVASVFSSDGRGVLNVGTNVKIKEQTRVYADIQTSFGGKITNDYQVNFGVRYSFGESASKEALKTKQD